VLTDCFNHSFILALNPDRNASSVAICPKLEEIVLHLQEQQDEYYIKELFEMTKGRASRGAKLSTIVIVCPREHIPVEWLDLSSHVSRVEYRLDNATPRWDVLPGETDEAGYDSDW